MKTFKKMNKLAAIFLILLCISWTTHNDKAKSDYENSKLEKTKPRNLVMVSDDLYHFEIELVSTENNEHELIVSIELKKSALSVFPTNKQNFKGEFYMDLADYANLNFENNIIENPQPVQKVYPQPFVDGSINWVYNNKDYKQSLRILSKNDFKVMGRLKLTVNPSSTIKEIPFVLIYKDGEFKIESAMC